MAPGAAAPPEHSGEPGAEVEGQRWGHYRSRGAAAAESFGDPGDDPARPGDPAGDPVSGGASGTGPATMDDRALLDALPVAVVGTDGQGRITHWNPAAEDLYGHPRPEVVHAPAIDVLVEPAGRAVAAEAVARALAAGRWEGELALRCREGDGVARRCRLVGVGGGVVWVTRAGSDGGLAEQERSQLVRAELAARVGAEEAHGLLDAVLQAAPVGVAVLDQDLRYVTVNQAYAALSGRAPADHTGAPLAEVVPIQPGVVANLRRVLTTGRTILGREVELEGNGWDRRTFTAGYFPVCSSTGTLMGAGLTLVETTEERRAEAERIALLRRAEAAQQRLAILATASTVLTTTMVVGELTERLCRVLTPVVADWCAVELLDRDGAVEHVSVSHRDHDAAAELAGFLRSATADPGRTSPVAEALRTGQARLERAASIEDLVLGAAGGRGRAGVTPRFPVRSSAVVPIQHRGRVLGVFILATKGDRGLDAEDLDLAVEIAHRAALAVVNAQAFQQEHQIAESLQRALLPATVPSVPGLDLAVRYLAATDGASVGGDWYDVLAFDDGTTGVVVGDVVGHDIAASTAMGQLRSALRVFAWEEPGSPAAALARADRLADRLGLAYATCILGLFDPGSLTFRWGNAGHPPPVLVRDGAATFLDHETGVLLGVTGGVEVRETTTELRPGDLLVLYTDGLVERRDEPLQAGLERLVAVATEAGVEDAQLLCDALVDALVPPSARRDDDVAILVAHVTRPVTAARHRVDFDPVPESAALVRGFTAGVLQAAGHDAVVDTAVLLASEIVTNAIRHAGGACALVVSLDDDSVEVSVEDGDRRLPTPRQGERLGEGGRGLVLVDALADQWGVRPLAGGKATWFVLRLPRG